MLNQTKPKLGFTPHHFLNKTHKSFPITPPSLELDFFRSSFNEYSDENVNPNLYISSQYYTFNQEYHSLMIKCILAGKFASSGNIQAVTPAPVLSTWKSVRKDRCEGTAYVTTWKRIQEKLRVVQRENGNYFLCFGSNGQFVANTSQWQDIVMSFHCDDNYKKHFGVKDTIDRVRKVWTVGGKMYGVPESFIRACVGKCRVCVNGSGGSGKRRRFEYTESFDVSARDVCRTLRQLAVEHKVVLCIRQKYCWEF